MVDEMFDRQYQAGREQLNASFDRLGHRLQVFAAGFSRLNRIQFAAPWAKKDGHCA